MNGATATTTSTTERPSILTRSQTPSSATTTRSRFGIPESLYKSRSSPNIHSKMAAVAGPLQAFNAMTQDHVMDTRTPSPVHRTNSTSTTSEDDAYKPDLGAEVAMLSTKLVNAINYQTNLDDSLQATRHELEQERQKRATAEEEKKKLDDMLSAGLLLKKADVDKVIAKLRSDLASERASREVADKAKKQTEGELDNLTSALFEEANTMVAVARKETEVAEKKIAQLRSQLKDNDLLLASQQEQLQDLKSTMEKFQDDAHTTRDPSIPTTPITNSTSMFDALQIAHDASAPPEHPLHFSQIISPVLRNDVTAYADFEDLLLLGRRIGLHSRQSSNQATPTQQASGFAPYAATTSSSSSPHLPGSFSFNSSSPSSVSPNMPALKESKFYKRALTEDIEPTLRLDLAPGLSFLSRRTVVSALLSGTLAIEPYPQSKHYFACTLCGESKRGEPYVRKFRFRTSEDDNVSKPICDYCVARFRSTCDFVGFLRMIRDGHWKCDTEEEQKGAWEESVRLREKMFWARIGGGVVPCAFKTSAVPPTPSSATGDKLGRSSLESIPERQAKAEETTIAHEKPADESAPEADDEPKNVRQAFVNMSSEAAAVSTPELQPAREGAVEDSKFVTPPPTRGLDADETNEVDAGASEEQATTPFEDASQQLEESLSAAAEKADPEHASEESNEHAVEESEESGQSLETLQPRAFNDAESQQLRSTKVDSPISLEQPSTTHERKASSVLARVRAMESSE